MADDAKTSVWDRAQAVSDFLTASDEDDVESLVDRVLIPGFLTLFVAPRGLGKTHYAMALAIALATGGVFLGQRLKQSRVLYVDRDNPVRELKRRAKAWNAEPAGKNLEILT